MNETQVTMVGNAVEDPVLRFGKSGQQFITFRLASTVRRRDATTGLFVDAGTNFVTVLAFRQLARNAAESIRKGQPVVVSGRLRVNQWTSGERTGTSVEIDAAALGHDLSRGIASFTKVKNGPFGEGSFPADAATGGSLGVAPTPEGDGAPDGEEELDVRYGSETRYDDADAPLPPYEQEPREDAPLSPYEQGPREDAPYGPRIRVGA